MRRGQHGNDFRFSIPAATDTGEFFADTGFFAVGFRLVHGDSGRVFRDGSWSSTGAYVAHGIYFMADPDYDCPRLGFRLAREEK